MGLEDVAYVEKLISERDIKISALIIMQKISCYLLNSLHTLREVCNPNQERFKYKSKFLMQQLLILAEISAQSTAQVIIVTKTR